MSLCLKKVNKSFGEKHVVKDLSFTIDKPCIFGLLGTNGAGKTTTIRMILGILERDSGSILWNNEEVKRENGVFGYLPEERGLYPKAKVSEQLIYFAKLRGITKENSKKALSYWAKRLEIEEYLNVNSEKLSKGNQQKVQLIAALLHSPSVLFLDEPFSGLDPVNTELFKVVIHELVEDGKYIIMSSHQMQAVEEYCKDILILKNGDTVLKGNLNEIKHSYGRTNLIIDCDQDISDIAEKYGIETKGKKSYGTEYKIKDDRQGYNILKDILDKGYTLNKFEIREPSLHEIFLHKAGENK